jgi:hypothetical protein
MDNLGYILDILGYFLDKYQLISLMAWISLDMSGYISDISPVDIFSWISLKDILFCQKISKRYPFISFHIQRYPEISNDIQRYPNGANSQMEHPGLRHPTGPARPRSLSLGTSQSKEIDADLSGVERVEGGGYGEPNREGPGSTKMCRYGKVALLTAIPHVIDWDTAPLRDAPLQGRVAGGISLL